jgi:hypothetical protein
MPASGLHAPPQTTLDGHAGRVPQPRPDEEFVLQAAVVPKHKGDGHDRNSTPPKLLRGALGLGNGTADRCGSRVALQLDHKAKRALFDDNIGTGVG